jgi:hypothetical protein
VPNSPRRAGEPTRVGVYGSGRVGLLFDWPRLNIGEMELLSGAVAERELGEAEACEQPEH